MTTEVQTEPIQAESKSQAATLVEIAKLYERQLHGDDPRGRQMLKRLGIHSKETISAFGIGFADGNLTTKVNEDQAKTLKAMGLISHNNKETLGNALTFPARDPEFGAIIDLLSLKEYQNRKANLLQPPRGLLNGNALKASNEIVLTDWLEAALAIHQAGWPAVIPLRGVDDLESNLAHFQSANLKRIWLATVKRGPELEALIQKHLDCELLRLRLHNDYKLIDAETLKSQMESAELLKPSRPRPTLLESTDDGAVYEHRGIRLRVSGLDCGNTKSLRMTLTASVGDKEHTDRLDLLSASCRKRFAKDCEGMLGKERAEMETVLHDLIAEAQEHQEEHRRLNQARVSGIHPNQGEIRIPEDRRGEAMDLLKAPDLTERIQDDIARLGLVGERLNALLLFLVAVSRKLDKPLSAILRSESASGKSNLVERILELLPEEDVVYVSRLSGNALFYMPPDSLRHRILVVEEREGGEDSDYAVRILQSKGFLTTAIPLPPEEPGVMRTKLITVKGPVAYVETTTKANIDPQNLNRCFEVNLDESPLQTGAILKERQRRRAITHEKTSRERTLELHRDMQRLLTPAPVLIPYANLLTFPNHQVRFRRDHERLLGLIDASALLHQHQREWRTTPRGLRMIVASPEDYAIAHELSARALSVAADELSGNGRSAWDAIRPLNGQAFTRREVMERLGWPYWKTYAALRELRNLDLLGMEPGKGPHPGRYLIRSWLPIRPDLGLLTPDALAGMLSKAVDEQADR